MTYDELKDLVFRIYEPARVMCEVGGMSMPRIMNHAAIAFWLSQPEETDDHRELRRQLNYLNDHGSLDVEPDQ